MQGHFACHFKLQPFKPPQSLYRGDHMFTYVFYTLAILAFIISFLKDKKKTKTALKKGYLAFINIMPEFLTVILIIGITLTLLDSATISKLIGPGSGALGIMIAAIIGAITLIPGFVAFPLARALLDSGAGIVPIAAFVSTLMMVGFVTIPLEIKVFSHKAAYIRNLLAFLFAVIIALIMGVLPWIN